VLVAGEALIPAKVVREYYHDEDDDQEEWVSEQSCCSTLMNIKRWQGGDDDGDAGTVVGGWDEVDDDHDDDLDDDDLDASLWAGWEWCREAVRDQGEDREGRLCHGLPREGQGEEQGGMFGGSLVC
jgi:hypothetical protein